MAYKYDLDIDAGSPKAFNLSLRDSAGELISLAGASVAAQIKYTYSDASPAATFTTAINANVITFSLTHVQTALLVQPNGVWDCEITWPSGTRVRLAEGVVRIHPEVTK